MFFAFQNRVFSKQISKPNLRPTTKRLRLLRLRTGKLAMYLSILIRNASLPDAVIWPCFSMAILYGDLFCSLSFEEQSVAKLQTLEWIKHL